MTITLKGTIRTSVVVFFFCTLVLMLSAQTVPLRVLNTSASPFGAASSGFLTHLQNGGAQEFSSTMAPIFIAAPVYYAEYQSNSVATGDFNGDGKPDLAVVNQCELSSCALGSVSILLGNGGGTLQPAVNYVSGGNNCKFVAVGDFNGDGKPDLLVLNQVDSPPYTNLVSILLGRGDGTFQPAMSFSPRPDGISNVALGDFNADGKLDMVVTDGIVVEVLLGKGDGTFQAGATYPLGGANAVAVGDLNSDGKPDLVITDSYGTNVLLGNGDGTFETAVNYTGYGVSIVLGDFNGDGKQDVILAQDYSMGVFLGNGDGTLQAELTYAWTFAGTTSMVGGDFNADGKQDLAVVSRCGQFEFDCATESVAVFLGNGDGTFQSPREYVAGTAPASAVATVDFDADGKLDLAVVGFSTPGSVSPLLGNGDGTFRGPVDYAAGNAGSVVGDFNGDGKLDLAVAAQCINAGCAGGGGGIDVLLGNGDGTFRAAVSYPTQKDSVSVATGDFNGDGKLDLVVTNACGVDPNCNVGSVSVLLGNGDGTFQPAVNYPAQYAPGFVAVGDFNGDGKLDLAVANSCTTHFCSTKGSLSIFFGNGDGTFRLAANHPVARFPFSLVVADFNGDGKADVALVSWCADKACTISAISVLLGQGNGSFRTTNYLTNNMPRSIAVGDFNADGKIDLVTAMSECPDNSCGTGLVGVLLGNGDGTFQAPVTYPTRQQGFLVAVADFNGDGKADVVSTSFSGTVDLFLGSGDGTLQPSSELLLPFGSGLATGDFNSDGKPDLAVMGTGAAILLNVASGFRYSTTIHLTSSYNPAYAGQLVTLAVSVVPNFHAGNPVGQITFNDGATPLATVSLTKGKAVFSTSSLSVGTHKLTVAYSGDSRYVPETSTAVIQNIELAPTTTTLTSSPNPSVSGQTVTFTATINSSGPGAPTGKVVFKDGKTTIGEKILSGEVATLTKSNLAVGMHSITATYDGDAASAKSTSSALSQVVN